MIDQDVGMAVLIAVWGPAVLVATAYVASKIIKFYRAYFDTLVKLFGFKEILKNEHDRN